MAEKTGRSRVKAAKLAAASQPAGRRYSRISQAPNAAMAMHAADNDDFVTIARHKLLRRKSLKVIVPEEEVKTIYEIRREALEHVVLRTSEELEKERKERAEEVANLRRRLMFQDWDKARQKREDIERLLREEEERLAAIKEEEEKRRREKEKREREEREEAERLRLEQEERERLEREEAERIRLEEEERARIEREAEEERQRVEREAAERRAELERRRREADEEIKRKRREEYQRKLDAVVNATSQHDREQALKEVGKLTINDFNNQEEWERHQREVGRLNILEIAGNFKKKGRKFRKQRHKTQTIHLANAKAIISKFANEPQQDHDEVIGFVKPRAVDLSDMKPEVYKIEDDMNKKDHVTDVAAVN